MNTFFKTFFICLIISFSFLAYKYFATDSYSADLNISKSNPIFGIHEEDKQAPIKENTSLATSNKTTEIESNTYVTKEKFEHKCYFYSNNGKLILITRSLELKPSIENSVSLLLKGPLIAETKKGIYSEIPANVDLISIKRLNNDIIVDLSSNFGNGGGSQSVQNRVMQLSKTVKLLEPNKNVYLYINGKEVEYLGGDGVYIKQPLD